MERELCQSAENGGADDARGEGQCHDWDWLGDGALRWKHRYDILFEYFAQLVLILIESQARQKESSFRHYVCRTAHWDFDLRTI